MLALSSPNPTSCHRISTLLLLSNSWTFADLLCLLKAPWSWNETFPSMLRRVWPFSAKPDWPDYWWDSRHVSDGCLMLIDNCVALESHLLLLHIEQFVMARAPKLCNGCKSSEKCHDKLKACTVFKSTKLNIKFHTCSMKACLHVFNRSGLVQMLDLLHSWE